MVPLGTAALRRRVSGEGKLSRQRGRQANSLLAGSAPTSRQARLFTPGLAVSSTRVAEVD